MAIDALKTLRSSGFVPCSIRVRVGAVEIALAPPAAQPVSLPPAAPTGRATPIGVESIAEAYGGPSFAAALRETESDADQEDDQPAVRS